MRIFLFGLLLLATGCRRPSTQFAAMMTPTNQLQIADYTNNLKAGDDVVAVGNDPSWSLTINPSKGTMRFKAMNGDSLNTTAPERQNDSDGTFRYSAPVESGHINILFRPDSCVNKLSGQRYDYRVEVDYKGKNYVGCGVSLRQLALLQDIWVLTSLQDQPITANRNNNELPRLEISLTENRVTGTTGCNRLSGQMKADTRQILFGPLATTRMACPAEVGALESRFISELNTALTYQVAEGRLTLLRSGKPIMTFRKVD
ncbi:META domain-containing protein [Spirosoma endophyticum]|uniref:Heat shock protein HslJ n=1 Tax=Spirosoma endophyticum TaxID=662367 RepID=A0A1I1RJU9_9BACT|nr:META domain-containing protein [Spirosoma endophyticum]SFD34412.1 Heat shock protein HslJ [Spirosoma endophyticum]